jgi:murein DD-endopeptidase MepM/ murein hydrolase activator NlpD
MENKLKDRFNMVSSKYLFLLFIAVVFICLQGNSQLFAEKKYPQNYFLWPVAAQVALAANFGELRPNHYHMGLDCKTEKKVNLPVYAAAAGYISRVKIEPWGFGRSIMINHPNGISTLYAHLNDFNPALEKYIKEKQYQLKQWDVMIMLPENLFPVKKGDRIAFSGNTGGSQGPHLHFEIRDTKTEKVLNPLLFGFPVKDNVPPTIVRLAVYDRCISTYEQVPKIYALKKVNGQYVPVSGNINVKTDKVSFAISAFDQYTGSTNQNGIYKAQFSYDDKVIAGFEMDSIDYDETRYLNAHIDYKTKSNSGPYLEHLSKLTGYYNGIYKTTPGNDGVINLEDENNHTIRILVTDTEGNQSTLWFSIKRERIIENKSGFSPGKMFHPGFINIFENNNVSFYLPEKSLYDSFRFIYNETAGVNGNVIYQLHNTSVPLHNYFSIKIRSNFSPADSGRIIMRRFYGKNEDYKKATSDNGWYKASFREFGNFELMVDSIPPSIVPLGFKDGMNASKISRIKFSITDNTDEIKKFTGLLDGNWICFSNDKGRNFIYDIDEHCSTGEHDLKIIAEDLAGNKTEKNYHFTR